jgi:hypothetical protein
MDKKVELPTAVVVKFKKGEQELTTLVRPASDLNIDGLFTEKKEKFVRMTVGDFFGPAMYLSMSLDQAKKVSEGLVNLLKELEAK